MMIKRFSLFITLLTILMMFVPNAVTRGAMSDEGDEYLVYLPFIRNMPLNRAPNVPSHPSPASGSMQVSAHSTISWSGGDPDGNTVLYDVYFGAVNPPNSLVADDQLELLYTPTLAASTTYFWRVTAKDEHGLQTTGPVWQFRTSSITTPAGMVYVAAGNFTRGCAEGHNGGHECILVPWASTSDDLPSTTIYLDAFYMDTTEVTNAQYTSCVAAGKCTEPVDKSSSTHSSYYGNPIYANYPVINVSWSQANSYCTWAVKRLPTEAEWEKAARGSTDSRAFPWGDAEPLCNLTNYEGCVGDTRAVGSNPAGASPYGALDMAGNVTEWVNDWYEEDYYKMAPNTNPPGPATGTTRIMRGGSWASDSLFIRVANRSAQSTAYSTNRIGFRCASSAH
jgi:formylglycine-generating enzyme required for sulfatase activity